LLSATNRTFVNLLLFTAVYVLYLYIRLGAVAVSWFSLEF